MPPTAKQAARRFAALRGAEQPRLTNVEAAREKYAAGVLTLSGLSRALDYFFQHGLDDAPALREGGLWTAAVWESWNRPT